VPGFINSEALIEYFGMSGNPAYNQQMAHKIFTYKEAGIEGNYLTESSFSGDWQRWVLGRIEQTLEGKLRRISTVDRGDYATTLRS
jgi:hypothetical protein